MCFIAGMLDEARKTKESKKSKEFAGIDLVLEQPATTGNPPLQRASSQLQRLKVVLVKKTAGCNCGLLPVLTSWSPAIAGSLPLQRAERLV